MEGSHTVHTTNQLLDSFGWDILDDALHSPKLVLPDYPLLTSLKVDIWGKRFLMNVELKGEMEK